MSNTSENNSNSSITDNKSDDKPNVADNMLQDKKIPDSGSEDKSYLVGKKSEPCQRKRASNFQQRKTEQTSIDETFANISNTLMNYLESTKENVTNNVKTPDQSFGDYVRSCLELMLEPEKSVRKKLIIDALTKVIDQ